MTLPNPAVPARKTDDVADEEVRRYVRRSAVRALAVVVALVFAVGVASVSYEHELFSATQWVLDKIGLVGLLAILFVSDSLITPVPPDALLVIIASSSLHESWLAIVGSMGVLSAVAGNVAYALGRRVGDLGIAPSWFGHFRSRHERLVLRYGWASVALGAITPIPFSITCWTAGLLHMRPRDVAWATLLRIPRFFAYYLVIAGADDIVRLFL